MSRSRAFIEGGGYEAFHFGPHTWDVEKAKAHVEGKKAQHTINPAEAKGLMGMVRVDPEHAKTADLSRPIIAVRPASGPYKGYTLPIDGWHRLHRAHEEGVEELPMHVISGKKEREIRVR